MKKEWEKRKERKKKDLKINKTYCKEKRRKEKRKKEKWLGKSVKKNNRGKVIINNLTLGNQ